MKRRLSSDTRNVSATHAMVGDRKALCGAKRKWGVLLRDKPDEISCRRCRALLQLPPRFMTMKVEAPDENAPPVLAVEKEDGPIDPWVNGIVDSMEKK